MCLLGVDCLKILKGLTLSHVARLVHETKLNISDLNKKSSAAQLSRIKRASNYRRNKRGSIPFQSARENLSKILGGKRLQRDDEEIFIPISNRDRQTDNQMREKEREKSLSCFELKKKGPAWKIVHKLLNLLLFCPLKPKMTTTIRSERNERWYFTITKLSPRTARREGLTDHRGT